MLLFLTPLAFAVPDITFVNPTPSNNACTGSNTSFIVNTTITEANLGSVTYSFNGSNESYEYYNDSLVLMLNFDNASGLGENDTYVVDMSRYGNNATAYGGLLANGNGKYSGAFNFDGNDDYVNLSTDTNFAQLQVNMTITGWFNENGANGNPTIFSQYKSVGSHQLVKLVRLDSDKVNYFTSTSNGGWQMQTHTTPYTANIWNFFAIIVSGNYTNPSLAIWLNGEKQSFSLSALSTTPDTTVLIQIGWSQRQLGGEQFGGLIDEIRVFNKSVSDTEIYGLYAGNLRKYNSNAWELYINQAYNVTDGLQNGPYNYFVSATNNTGSGTLSSVRIVNIGPASAAPEWSDYCVLLILSLVIGGFFMIRKRVL
ncbi:LamG domain-containing protein [Candidatus Woesearchaeota archaeon]|nr:LamG domain-containing protein [Candidatus Woesearchaeota archaeon]